MILRQGDATTDPSLDFTHVYMYDKALPAHRSPRIPVAPVAALPGASGPSHAWCAQVFHVSTSVALAQLLNASAYRVLVSYNDAAAWRRFGLKNVQVRAPRADGLEPR